MDSSGELFMCSLEGYFGVCFPRCTTREINTKITSNEHINSSSKGYIHSFISYTTYVSWNDYENDDPHTSTPFLPRPVYVLVMTSQSIAGDVTITRLARTHEKWYLTRFAVRYISITAILTTGRVRSNYIHVKQWNMITHPCLVSYGMDE